MHGRSWARTARRIILPCLLGPLMLPVGPAHAIAPDGPGGAGVLVAFDAGTSAEERRATHARAGGVLRETLEEERIDVVDVGSGLRDEALARYRADAAVRWAEPNRQVTLEASPNDPLFPGNGAVSNDLWGLHNTGQHQGTADADIDAPEAWDLGGVADGYAVGVIDTGVDTRHEDLQGRLVTPCFRATSGNGTISSGCEDDHGHGTHVAGTIAAQPNNRRGTAGVAPGARVVMCKALNHNGSGTVSDIVACMNRLVDQAPLIGMRVISLSLGGSYSSTEHAAVRHAWESGVVVVAAAGNEGSTAVNYPAGFSQVISVAATDRQDRRASFSNANDDVELSAPGVGIVSTFPDDDYLSYSGTSMATPHVAAAAAMVARRYGGSPESIRQRLNSTADDLGPPGRDAAYGFGRLNLCEALGGDCARGSSESRAPVAAFTVSGGPGPGQAFNFDGRASSAPGGTLQRYAWDFDGNGSTDATGALASAIYPSAGRPEVTLTVTDSAGRTASASRTLTVAADSRPPVLRSTLGRRYDLAAALRTGIRVRCRASETGTCRLVAEISPSLARRMRLRSMRQPTSRTAGVVIADGSTTVRAGRSATVTARLSSPAARVLRDVRSVKVTLRLTAADRTGNRSAVERRAVLAGSRR